MDKEQMLKAFRALDARLKEPTKLLIGGGAALLIAYDIPLSTRDVDGIIFQSAMSQAELDPLVKAVANDLGLPGDWLNGYFNTFLYALPADYGDRLQRVCAGRHLTVYALGPEDLLICKCFAGREKDIGHARALMRKAIDLECVDRHLQTTLEKGLPHAREAADFFDDLRSQLGK